MSETPGKCRAFTLVEALVAIAVVGLASALIVPSLQGAFARAEAVECASKLRSLGVAIHSCALENQGEFPRSFHSAAAHGQHGWTSSILPYLASGSVGWGEEGYARYFRCPSHRESNPYIFSYAMNVHFELDPQGDDYVGSPETWRRVSSIASPRKTILLAETRPILFGDHLMCHLWSSSSAAVRALAAERHAAKPCFLFVDGHVENLKPEQTFHPPQGLNLWNPSLADASGRR